MRVPKKLKDQVKKKLNELIDKLEVKGELPLLRDNEQRVFLLADVSKDYLDIGIRYTDQDFLPESIYFEKAVYEQLGQLVTLDGLKKLLLDEDFINCFAKNIARYLQEGDKYLNSPCLSAEDVWNASKSMYFPERIREEVVTYEDLKERWPTNIDSFEAAKKLKELIEYENPEYYVPLFGLQDELVRMLKEFVEEGVNPEGSHRKEVHL